MRGAAPELRSRSALASTLPGLLQADDLCVRFTEGLDPTLAPVVSTLDNLLAYVDPAVAPADFLDWLGGWFGIALHPQLPEDRRRALVARAAELQRWRGTVRGIAALVELVTGEAPAVDDGGGVWSTLDPSTPLPGGSDGVVRVRLRRSPPADLLADLRRTVRAELPASLGCVVEAPGA